MLDDVTLLKAVWGLVDWLNLIGGDEIGSVAEWEAREALIAKLAAVGRSLQRSEGVYGPGTPTHGAK